MLGYMGRTDSNKDIQRLEMVAKHHCVCLHLNLRDLRGESNNASNIVLKELMKYY